MTNEFVTPDILIETFCICGGEFIEVAEGLWVCNKCGLRIIAR